MRLLIASFQRRREHAGVQFSKGVSQPSLQYDLSVVVPLGLGRLGSNVGPCASCHPTPDNQPTATCSIMDSFETGYLGTLPYTPKEACD